MIKFSNDYTLELKSQPGIQEDCVVTYVESQFNPGINRFIADNLEEIKSIFKKQGLEFIFIPENYQKTEEVFDESIRTSEIRPSVICNGGNYRDDNSGMYRFEAYHLDLHWLDRPETMLYQFQVIAEAYSRHGSIDYKERSEDKEVVNMLYEMERLARALKAKGVKSDLFDDMIHSLEQPSKLVINSHGCPILPDYGNMEIKLSPIEKTLYIFFLNHPEGILADELVGHQNELMAIYSQVSIFDDWEMAQDAIYALCEESKSTLYTNISRMKRRFTDKLGIRMASHYIIQKNREGIYKITLPRELVTWEDNLLKTTLR